MWDTLATRLHVSRALAKHWAYLIGYGGHVDPWVDYLVNTELAEVIRERR